MTELLATANNLVAALEFGAEIFLVLGLLVLALWRRDVVFYVVSGVATFFIGMMWVDSYTGVSIATLFLAGYQLFSGIVLALTSDKPGRGWSQFRGIYNQIRELF